METWLTARKCMAATGCVLQEVAWMVQRKIRTLYMECPPVAPAIALTEGKAWRRLVDVSARQC